MARKTVESSIDVSDVIARCGKHEDELNDLKKLVDEETTCIKQVMANSEQKELSAGGYKVKYVVQHRESFNEDVLLEILQRYPKICAECGIIKTKSYVDFGALEDAIYNGKFETQTIMDFDIAREVKEVATLRFTKEK